MFASDLLSVALGLMYLLMFPLMMLAADGFSRADRVA